jgi:cation diffusion facilitator CzcD-associated flavoprotein CzcO
MQHTVTTDDRTVATSDTPTPQVHIAILGTGFAGLGMAIQLKQHGEEDFIVLERAAEIGGTWRDNTYPGCACDVPSHLYSFSFAPNPHWSRAYSPQAEIQAYLRTCAQRFGITPHIRWNHALQEARWDEEGRQWQLTTSQGLLRADLLILGQGPLSEPALPTIPGITQFAGTLFHSAEWRHDHDLRGERVAIVGTGASAIQLLPQIQPQAQHIDLYMRTPPWIIPRNDHAIPAWRQRLFRMLPVTQRAVRGMIYLQREIGALGLVYRPQLMRGAAREARKHLMAQVSDPTLQAQLTPHYTMGCKRILLSDDFYPAVSQPNVALVTDAIREVRPHSIITTDGTERAIDTLICATGFHVTDMPIADRVIGRGGQSLEAAWHDGIQAYLGTAVAGFPNLFLLIGPNTGLGHTSMIYMMESQFTYILDALAQMARQQVQVAEVRPTLQTRFNDELQQRLGGTVWLSGCASWYLDAKGHNTTLWPGFTFEFRRRTRHFDPQSYTLQKAQRPAYRR